MAKQQGQAAAPCRFGALRRVSTEGQDKKGESLHVQKEQIEGAVELLGGQIIEWYGGQEHATAGYEKKEIDRLLADAGRGRFDAVIVDKGDRWSRDNAKSHQGLDLFVEHGIKFFIGATEYDLNCPEHRLFIDMGTVFGAFQARSQKQRSLASRIKRAKRGCSACGKRPWGRTWNKETEQWGIDNDKQAIIAGIAKRYLAGESMQALADELGVNNASLWKTLTQRCGDGWVQTFRPVNRPPEVVVTQIPRLLPEATIQAIRQKTQANKTYTHGHSKHTYLLSRMIFCEHCGYAMFGQTNHRKHEQRYYRHAHTRRVKACDQPNKTWIPADEVEELVILHLFGTFGNPLAIQRAISAASGDVEKVKAYRQKLNRIDAELKKIEEGKEALGRRVLKGTLDEAMADKLLLETKDREQRLHEEQITLTDYLGTLPSPQRVEAASKKVATEFQRLMARISTGKRLAAHKPLSKMTYEERRALVETVFSGKMADGERMGVYIRWDGEGNWTFSIHGHLIEESGLIRWGEKLKSAMAEDYEHGAGWPLPKQKELVSAVTKSACDCTAQSPP